MSAIKLNLEMPTSPRIERLEKLTDGLTDRRDLHESIGGEAGNLTREYLRGIAPARHATAQRLGATPSGHLERAAESVSSRADADAATVGVTSPGMSRAFGDVTIKPAKKFLTIPANAEAYGKRAGMFTDLRFVAFGSKVAALVKKGEVPKGEKPEVYFWLVKSVFQKQDRSLLPSDDLLLGAAEEGTLAYLRMLLAAR